ncbi:MAG: CDP-diacylglycerol--glycerol-3-phosphate 3-phosphatidyltransferase [Christensenellaceae bacterium]
MSLANKLTLARLAMVPVFLAMMEIPFPHHTTWAAAVFLAAALTDLLDGYFARRQGTVSGFGKIFDPIADKILVLSALLPLAVQGRLSVWVVLILVGREFIVSAVRIQASSQGGTIIAASLLGKVKTVLQDAAIIMMLMEPELAFLKLWYLSDAVMAAAVLLTLWSLWDYCYRNRGLFSGL